MLALVDQVAVGIAFVALSCLFIAYVLYPMLMVVIGLAAYRPLEAPLPDDQCPTVTLIVPCYNEGKVIARKLENALNLDYPPTKLQIIVADDCSTDDTRKIAEKFQSDQVLVVGGQKRSGKNELINRAVTYARGDVLCLCDANVFFKPDAVRRLVTRLVQDPRCGAVTGRVRIQSELSNFGVGERFYYWVEWSVQRGESVIGSLTAVDGGMYVVWRSAFHRVPPDVPDDLWQSWSVLRSGKAIRFEYDSLALETPTLVAQHELARRIRMMSAITGMLLRAHFPFDQPIYMLQICNHKLLRWLTPLWLFLLLLGTSFVSVKALCRPESVGQLEAVVLTLWIAQCVFYSAAVAGAMFPRLRRSGVICVPFYFVLANVGMAIGWVRGLLFHRSPIWERTPRLSVPSPQEPHKVL